jgi:ubiquinone/menaquinone biosynthesis C-methylase UbiE
LDVPTSKVLLAGCGTGKHSIDTASRFKNSKVTAIDLSLSGLAYSKRKTSEFKLHNVEYLRSNILKLSKLEKHFDFVESCGVIHHMDDPMEGWKVLTDLLKPGGLMKIGLYSELARQNVTKIRQEIITLGIAATDRGMKGFRQSVISQTKRTTLKLKSHLIFIA